METIIEDKRPLVGIEDSKLYELVLTYKSDLEKSRDEINKYYTSLFSALISFMPFIDRFASSIDTSKGDGVIYVFFILSLLGIILSVSWIQTLRRIYAYIKGMDEVLAKMEQKFDISFINYMLEDLSKTHAPARITKQAMLVPCSFIIIFIAVFTYTTVRFWF